MSNYYYSSITNSFYPAALFSDYVSAGSWPADAISVTDALFMEYSEPSSVGKIRSSDENGKPCWIERPALTQAEEVTEANVKRANLLSTAQDIIVNWQSELSLGIISDDDKATLITWLKYIKLLQAIDTSQAPNITWPDDPEQST
jgi:hypothetical protein